MASTSASSNEIESKSFDVAIVGAGLAGLTAAKNLLTSGKSVIVLEARNRVGGKVLNKTLDNGGIVEVGAEFVGPTQDRVLSTISDLGLSTFNTYNQGKSVFWRNDTRNIYTPDPSTGGLPPVDEVSLLQLATAQAQLDAWAAEIDVSAPWSHPKAQEWDAITFAHWVLALDMSPDAKFLLGEMLPKSIFGAEPREVSLLYMIAYIASAGNETTTGTVNRLISVENAAQEQRVEGGTGLIPERLADSIGREHIALCAAVSCITKTALGYDIVSKIGTIKAKKVVIAMSPPLVNDITFSPPLPKARQQLNTQMKLGAIGKGIAVYKTPFWRNDSDLSAQVISDRTAKLCYDNSPSDASFGAVMAFISGDDMRALDPIPVAEVETAVTSNYSKYFGLKAKDVEEFVLQRWDLEEWSKGGPVAVAPPGVLTKWGPALREVVDGIHWAGTETSEYWTGYMDGAIRSGERVAREISKG